jgi:DNA-binding LacI/PurR family transcriptional regulator
MPSRPPSIDEVARIAGVSRSAVSRAYTPGASVAPATRERIATAARQIGYSPNLLARSLSRQQSKTIGIAVTRLDNLFNAILLQRIALGLRSAGYGVRLFVSHGDEDADPGLEEIVQHRVDALIVCAIGLTSTLAMECSALGIPVVMVNRRTDDTTTACVTGDNRVGGACIARFLAACGHRRFAFMGGTPGSSTSRDRQAGFIEALHDLNMPAPQIVAGMWDTHVASSAARSLFAAHEPPDALFCANDHMATAALTVATREFGLVAGDDVSIVGFDDTPCVANGAGLTTYAQPMAALADHAVAAALAMIGGKAADGPLIIPGRLVVRGSSRVPDGCRRQDGETIWEAAFPSTRETGE